MTERRITEHPERQNNLKAVAGLMQKLSYREMQTLAQQLHDTGGLDISVDHVAGALLKISDKILAEQEPRR